MHRNTFLLVAILAVVAALILGINIGQKTAVNTQLPTPTETPQMGTPAPTGVTLLNYENTDCGFALQYSGLFTLEETDGGATLTHLNDPTNIINIVCQADIPRIPLTPDRIEILRIGTVSAELYHDASQEDGSPVDKFIFTHPTRKIDIYIAGYGEAFNEILKTLTLFP